jgi:hypothetical protein
VFASAKSSCQNGDRANLEIVAISAGPRVRIPFAPAKSLCFFADRAAKKWPLRGSLKLAEVTRLVLFSAYDAGLDRPQEVTPSVLRYTFIGYLLRQGIRAADIDRIVGRMPQTELLAYMQLNSPSARRPIEDIERVLPALRKITATRTG